MPDYIVNGTDLTSVANAIRTAGGTSGSLTFPSGFVSAIGNLGGSSDFTTAEVTVNNNTNEFVTVIIPNIITDDGNYIMNENWAEDETPITCVVPLYKGNCICPMPFKIDGPPATVAVTGDITWSDDVLTITGDGTITLS